MTKEERDLFCSREGGCLLGVMQGYKMRTGAAWCLVLLMGSFIL